MTISPAKVICAALTALFLSAAPFTAVQSAPLSLTPAAQNTPKASVKPLVRKALRHATRDASPSGHADLAFLSAGQYLDLSIQDKVIPVLAENELSPLDFTAGIVRVVDPDELSEIDLANEPDVLIAEHQAAAPIQQASAAPARSDDADEDDGVLNRILMTFAGALAMASAMRMIIA